MINRKIKRHQAVCCRDTDCVFNVIKRYTEVTITAEPHCCQSHQYMMVVYRNSPSSRTDAEGLRKSPEGDALTKRSAAPWSARKCHSPGPEPSQRSRRGSGVSSLTPDQHQRDTNSSTHTLRLDREEPVSYMVPDKPHVNHEIWLKHCWGVIMSLPDACLKGIGTSVWKRMDCRVIQKHPD